MNIGKAIKAARKEAGLTQVELAKAAELTQASLSQIENGTISPSPKTQKKICEILKISEPLLYILSIDEHDVPEEKKNLYNIMYPSIEKLAKDLISRDDS